MTEKKRMGLAGTGYWARVTHAPAVVASRRWELAAVWGRNANAVTTLAEDHRDALPESDFDQFLERVDAVTFALPPHVQAPLALRAIAAGKHVLLEKPIALDLATADELVSAAESKGVATMVLFTMLYDPRVRKIISHCREQVPLRGGTGVWLGSALNDANPFNTPWRHEKGGLWDVGPHALSVLWKTVGPISGLKAYAGERDLRHLILTHTTGATSTVTLTLQAPDAADGFATTVWGESGRIDIPVDDVDARAALTLALDELGDNAAIGATSHPCDVAFGRDIVRILADAEAQISAAPDAT